jgi:hypothetical protein
VVLTGFCNGFGVVLVFFLSSNSGFTMVLAGFAMVLAGFAMVLQWL